MKVLGRGQSAQGALWSVDVVEVAEAADGPAEFVEVMGQVVAGREVAPPRSIGALRCRAKPRRSFRAIWRQDVARDALGLAGGIELGHELGTADELDAGDWEGQLGEELVEELACCVAGGAVEGWAAAP